MRNFRKPKHAFLMPALLLVPATIIATISLGRQIWANSADMTELWFGNVLFCQRVSQAINDSLGNGMADGSDCVNFNLRVSTTAIDNIQTLNILPPQNGYSGIDWDSQSMTINGEWVSAFYNLTSLSITNLYVEDISPLRNLTGDLTYLNLSGNRIGDVTPLESLANRLEYLDLSGNPVGEGMRELSRFTELTTLKLANTGYTYFDELFSPPTLEAEYDEITGNPTGKYRDTETGELLSEEPTGSKLAKVLEVFDISNNEYMSGEKTEEDKSNTCDGSLTAFGTYADDLAITDLYADKDNLNSDDLICISELKNLANLDVSENHIDDFSSIKTKTYASLAADSQLFTRSIESLDYEPLPMIFTQAQQENYFTAMPNVSNTAVALSGLSLDNAQFNGTKVRFENAAIASMDNEDPRPATVAVPANTGAFENSKLQVYFTGQVVTFNDSNLCNQVYQQGYSGIAFASLDGNTYWSSDEPVVLTNACSAAKKQIAMVSGGSSQFLRLSLNSVNGGAVVDLTGLEEFGNLERLWLRNNSLTDISNIANMYSLQQLYLDDNNLDSEDWSVITDNLSNLRILYLNNNHMSEISPYVTNLYNLGNLYLVNNGISDVSPLAQLSSLTALDLSENAGITDFSGLVQDYGACDPTILKLEDTGVTRLPDADVIARGFPSLISLNLNGNQITDDTIANLASAPMLEELYLEDNQISNTAGFSGITTLIKLFLDRNRITDVSGLTSLTNLTELHLNSNQIGDVTGLNTLPELATLDLRNQTLTGAIAETGAEYILPAVFSQTKTLSFPKVSGFQSTEDYAIENGTVDYDTMTATMTDTSEIMTVTIPDGGLAGTKVTVTYTGEDEEEFTATLTDYTNNNATFLPTSANTFTVTSNQACMALWTGDNGTTWHRLDSNTVDNNDNAREFNLDQTNAAEIIIALIGDANTDGNINVRDARRIVNAIMSNVSLSSLETKLADVDGNNTINVRDVRKIINSITGAAAINW